MSDEIKINRAPQQQSVKSEYAPSAERSKGPSKAPWVILVVIVLILAGLAVLFRDRLFGAKSMAREGYQAVFLTNGQVYFGRLADATGDYATLKDIYYLQVVQPPLQGTPQASDQQPSEEAQISLVKLGNELHGPVDEMHISRSQILFYEDLKNDGNVVKAIESYKANPAK